MLSSLGCLLLCGSIALALGNAQKLPKGKKPNLKVHINTTSDSIFLKFLRPSPNVKLEGFLLGYGSNLSPNQYFPLPAEGKYTEAVVDAEPKYLIVVRPAPPPSQKKSCSGKARSRKPLQLVVGTLTPSSVFLSWGFLINPNHDWTLPSQCPNDRFYTIRYREKDKEKKWIFQLCPATETIVENLKPDTVYEFGVKDNVEGGIWSKIFNHKTIVGSKSKVNGKIQSTYDQVHTVPSYVPRKLIPVTIIKQVIQNVTHKASTKSPDKTPFGGTILVHLVIPGLNETVVKLPTSIMFEISDAIKTQLAKNETLALPAESKTPEVEKIPARPITVTPESVPRTTKPTVSSALDISETTLALRERTPETSQTILIPRFEFPLSTLAPKRLPEFPQAKTPFPFEKPGGTLASSEKPWIVPTSKTSEDSKILPPQTAAYDVFSSSTTSDEPEISEPYTATSDLFLDSVPPKTSRTLEQPRATLAPRETPFVPQKPEIFSSPEMQPTTPAPLQTTSVPSTPKRRPRPKTPRTKPERTTSPGTITSKISKSPEPTRTTLAPSKTQFISLKPKIPLSPEVKHTRPALKPETPPPPQSPIVLEPGTLGTKPSTTTLAPPKTKRPGRRPRPRPRPKTTPSPDVPKSKPALEPATVQQELLVPTIDSKPPKQLPPIPQTTAKPDIPPSKSVFEDITFEMEAPSTTIVPATDIEPVTLRTEAPQTTLAPKTSQRTRPHRPRPRPKYKTTPSPETPQTKLAPTTTTTKRPRRPRPKAKTTPRPEAAQTKLVPATIREPGILGTEAPGMTVVPATVFEPVTPIKEAPVTTFVPPPPPPTTKRPRRPRPKTKTTPRPEAAQTKLVPATIREPGILRTEAPGTTVAPTTTTTTKRPRRPRPKAKTTPRREMPQTKLVPAIIREPGILRTEAPGTTVVPATVFEPVTPIKEAPATAFAPPTTTKRPRRPRPKTKTTPRPEAAQTKLVPATIREPGILRTEAPGTTVVPATVFEPVTPIKEAPATAFDLEPVTFTTETSGTALVPTDLEPVTLRPEAPGTTLVPTADFEPVTFRTEAWVTTKASKTSKRTRRPRPKLKTTPTPEAPQAKLALTGTDYVYPAAKAPLRPEETKTEAVESITYVSEPPETTLALKEIPRAPPKPKTSPHPRIPQTQPAPQVLQRVTLKPRTSPSPEVSYTSPVPRDVLLPHKPDTEVSQRETVLQPVTFETDLPEPTIAPLETRGSPFIPMISPSSSQEELQTTPAETDQFTQELFTTKIPRTTEVVKTTPALHRLYTTPVRPRTPDKPHFRPVLNKTTTKPSRPKPSGLPKWDGMGTGVKQMPLPSGAGRNVSVDSTYSTKKTAPIPGTRRPLLPPRPMPPRRKPLPPNNVTGKPGSTGIISSGQVTSSPLRATFRPTEAPLERTEVDGKLPTVPASGEDLGNMTDFSSSPTRETDPLGKPRFKGPHVRYIQKPDNRPCSITDSIKRFPKEEATEGNATSPPQNPPTNLTVVTVEGCPSFVILDWDKPLNDTVTEYEVISRENGSFSGKNKSIQTTNQTFSTVENLKPDTSYEFQVKPKNPLGEGPASNTVSFSTESADPRVSEPVSAGRDAIWTERPFNSDSYSECKGKQYVKRTWYKKFVGVQLCNSLRYKIYLSDSLTGKFYNIGDQRGHGEDHCQFVDSFLDGRTGQQLSSDQLPTKEGYFRAVRQEPVQFGEIGGHTQINYVQWYECGTTIPGKW
ncbi:target of Nesh-SH3 isoform X47 [Vicugna pacos]|uniref:Target of Nesh-SH3 isoform X47 n=1 Tax=Vicugna pacos TaxID=30538 RepID=A0ABM5DNX2_VICPA